MHNYIAMIFKYLEKEYIISNILGGYFYIVHKIKFKL